MTSACHLQAGPDSRTRDRSNNRNLAKLDEVEYLMPLPEEVKAINDGLASDFRKIESRTKMLAGAVKHDCSDVVLNVREYFSQVPHHFRRHGIALFWSIQAHQNNIFMPR